jgi:nucleoside-diphosphate-sugar epimerase
MKILLIGHKGYLGRGLHQYFKKNNEVVGWDIEDDLFSLTTEFLKKERIQILVNLSVVADRQSTNFQFGGMTDHINIGGARHLAKILHGTDIAWIQMSTREVLGPVYTLNDVTMTNNGFRPKFLVGEDAPLAPFNFYGKSKIVSEFIAESHPYSNIIRLTTCYTDFDHPAGNWVVSLIRAAVNGKPVTLTQEGGLQFRDPLHTDDLGQLMELLYEKKVFGHILHAGGGDQNMISLRDFILTANPNATIQVMPGGDVGFAFDITKAQKLTGWDPKISVLDKIPLLADNIKLGICEPQI